MTCPVNVSLSGGYPDGRTRRRAKNPPSLRRSEVYPFVCERTLGEPQWSRPVNGGNTNGTDYQFG